MLSVWRITKGRLVANGVDEGKESMASDGVGTIRHNKTSYKFKRPSSCMNITPRLKSTLYDKGIIFNLSIKIPLPHKHLGSSLTSSPNHTKKHKLSHNYPEHRTTLYTSQQHTLRDLPQYPSRKKYTSSTPMPSSRGGIQKAKSTQLSPNRKALSRKGKDTGIVRNVSILQQVVNDQDNIIKYTSNSNELKQKLESLRNLNQKVQTQFSEVDISEIRAIESKHQKNKIRPYYLANDFLRVACAKKIQRAWRRYKTKQIIRSYSNDIRKKDVRKIQPVQQLTIKSARSYNTGLKLKMNPNQQMERPQTDRAKTKISKFQEQSIQKWQQMVQRIKDLKKDQKNVDKLLQISIERKNALKRQLGNDFFKPSEKPDFFKKSPQKQEKIIKTKGYYQQERDKRKELIQRSIGSVNRQQRVKYFENEMLKIENDISDVSSDRQKSNEGEGQRQLQQLQNIKLRKKLQVFKQHLPQINPFNQQDQNSTHTQPHRIDIATLIKRKTQQIERQQILDKQKQPDPPIIPYLSRSEQQLQLATPKQKKKSELCIVEQQLSSIQTYRDWTPTVQIEDQEDKKWVGRLFQMLKKKDNQMITSVLQELILQALIEISDSEKLIQFIKNIYDKGSKKQKKPQGIVTSHASIKDYLNYFINYIYEHKLQNSLLINLKNPVGPTPRDVLRYFRGEDPSQPESEYVMSIKLFNQHWQYANDFIYFDPKFQDPSKQRQRVSYLKQLTKVFFRSIFDCFNQSLQHQRVYGMRGKPYPWSPQKAMVKIPDLRQSILDSFQRVIKMATVFSGVLFEDKHHNLDKKTMDEIQQENMVKLILMECEEDQCLWNFYQDEMVQTHLEVCNYIEQRILMETIKDIVKFTQL